MATNPFRADGEWLRAQFHAHSFASDGELPPEAVARQYAHQGFDVLTISDHWTMTKVDAPEGLLLVPGAELMVDPVAGPMCPEFLAIGIDDVPETPERRPRELVSVRALPHQDVRDLRRRRGVRDGAGRCDGPVSPGVERAPAGRRRGGGDARRDRAVERVGAAGERPR